MHTRSFQLLFLLLASMPLHAQGWQSVGPDSTSWQNVRRVSGKWLSPTSYRLAAATAYNGVTLYSSPAAYWDYKFKTWYNPTWGTGTGYYFFDFSPWEEDSAFVGYAHFFVEPAFYIQKVALNATLLPSQPPQAGCWTTPLGLLFPPTSDSLVLASVCGLHRSNDRGMTWDTISSPSWGVSFAKLLGMNKTHTQILYKSDQSLQQYRAVLYSSTNRGRDWDSIFTAGVSYLHYVEESPYNMIAVGDTIIVGVQTSTFDTSSNIGIFRSTNHGVSWSHVYAGKRVVGVAESNVSPNTLFAASEAGILRSTDWGATWAAYNNALPTTRLTSLLISPYSDTMFVSTETHGVLKVWQFLTDVAEENVPPARFELMQNYPNPFNASTKIKFEVGGSGTSASSVEPFVSLKVYDLLGREVATLVNEVMGPGRYERLFNADGLASGVYLYQLQAGGFVQTRKLLLVR